MANLNLKAAFWPTERADADTFWLGLGVIALIDTVRLSISSAGDARAWLVILLLLVFLHTNRLRDTGRSAGLLALPLLLGVAAKAIVASVALFFALMPVLYEFFQLQGLDITDPAASEAFAQDLEMQAAFQAYVLESPDITLILMDAMAWPSHWGFWLMVGVLARWFARMPSRA